MYFVGYVINQYPCYHTIFLMVSWINIIGKDNIRLVFIVDKLILIFDLKMTDLCMYYSCICVITLLDTRLRSGLERRRSVVTRTRVGFSLVFTQFYCFPLDHSFTTLASPPSIQPHIPTFGSATGWMVGISDPGKY